MTDLGELQRILAGAQAPRALDRLGRVALLREAADALLDGRAPRPEAAAFLGAALSGWLARGGRLERDFLKVNQPGSHLTPQRLAALLDEERQGEGDGLPSGASSTDQGNLR